ncbi:MAG: long-chain fatty acid--CoA ligase [Alphaproteobacteria bacterium]|nr:long-chain fatty acid--CoA ligase [Alphaproteobacteria bacterium]
MKKEKPHPWAKKYPASIDWNAPLPARPLYGILDDAVRDFPDQVFIDFLGKNYTYREINDLVARVARGLQDLGIAKGERVGLMLPNSPYYIVLYFAALRLGAVVVNFNPLYAAREVEQQVRDSGCRFVAAIDRPDIYGKLTPLLAQSCLEKIIVCRMAEILPPLLSSLYPIFKYRDVIHVHDDSHNIDFARLTANDGAFTPAVIDPENDLAVLQYTGGTTGTPKGAMLTHANLSINVVQSGLLFPGLKRGQEAMMAVLPFFHIFALTAILNITVWLAGKIILLPSFDLGQVIKTIHKKRPTLFPAVPTIYTAINRYKNLNRYDLRSIKYCFSGGAPLPVEVKHDFERLTGCVLVEGYGLSETSPVVSCNPVEGESRAGSIGLPVPGTIIEIVSLDDKKTLLPPRQDGEICVRGPQVMSGYWHRAKETAQVLDGPRLHTGDVGYMDEDGYTFVIDRIKDMIAVGGFKVYPRHVEEAIYQHPAVEECIVAGATDLYRGQSVKAFITMRQGKTLSAVELKAFLNDKLSPIEIPRSIEFRESLPKTAVGKLSRRLMVEAEKDKS